MGAVRKRPLWRTVGAALVVLSGGGYLGLLVMLYFLQTALVFPASRGLWRTPGEPPFSWQYEDMSLPVGKETTHGWYIPLDSPRATLVFSHGNGGTIADRLEYVEMFRGLGLSVLLYDYGGYGHSTGSPSEARCYADVRATWRYLTETRGIRPDHIILFGESLGGGVTVELAQEVQPAAVILQSTFLSITKRAQEILPFVPIRLFLKHRFDSAAKIGNVRAPILFIHSPDDTIIPFHHGKDLFALAPEPKTFLQIHGGHNEGPFESQQTYLTGIAGFLDETLGK